MCIFPILMGLVPFLSSPVPKWGVMALVWPYGVLTIPDCGNLNKNSQCYSFDSMSKLI